MGGLGCPGKQPTADRSAARAPPSQPADESILNKANLMTPPVRYRDCRATLWDTIRSTTFFAVSTSIVPLPPLVQYVQVNLHVVSESQ